MKLNLLRTVKMIKTLNELINWTGFNVEFFSALTGWILLGVVVWLFANKKEQHIVPVVLLSALIQAILWLALIENLIK